MFESQIDREEMDLENRVTAPDFHGGDDEAEFSLRPKTLAEYIGQDKAKENLSVYIEAAKRRGGAGSRPALRPARLGQNHPFPDHCKRDEHKLEGHLRSGYREAGGSGSTPY